MEYAGFWRRLGAMLLDTLIVMPLAVLVIWAETHACQFFIYWLVPSVIFNFWFYIHLVTKYGGTPGKRLLKLKICTPSGAPVTEATALLRYIVPLLLTICGAIGSCNAAVDVDQAAYNASDFQERILLLSDSEPAWAPYIYGVAQCWVLSEFIVLLLNKKRRGFDDFIAGTIVIKESGQQTTASAITPSRPTIKVALAEES